MHGGLHKDKTVAPLDIRAIDVGVGPVSYTHLDVYKRQDEYFEKHDEIYEGINARVIQHEYDHIEGVLFVEKLKPLKKKLIQRKLNDIKTGKATADYKIKFVRL